MACAVGVELAPSRHRLALAELAREVDLDDTLSGRVALIEGDCADEVLWAGPLAGSTLVFAGSLLFGESLMARLARCIEACESVRAVASLKRFAAAGGGAGTSATGSGLAGFRELPSEAFETSWTAPLRAGEGSGVRNPGAPVFLYIRGVVAAPASDTG